MKHRKKYAISGIANVYRKSDGKYIGKTLIDSGFRGAKTFTIKTSPSKVEYFRVDEISIPVKDIMNYYMVFPIYRLTNNYNYDKTHRAKRTKKLMRYDFILEDSSNINAIRTYQKAKFKGNKPIYMTI